MIFKLQQQNQRLFKNLNLALQIVFILALISGISWYLGKGQERNLSLIGALTLGGLGAIMIWLKPYLGLTVAAASLALENILPEIPLATSLTSMLGGLALIAFVYQRKGYKIFSYGLQPQMLLAGAFLLWQFITYPRASFYGDRNWLFTFFQLWILTWLASELLTPERQHFTMRVFMIASVASALYAYSQAHLVEQFSYAFGLNRGIGFAGDQNSLALYLSTAFVFAAYFHRQSKNRWASLIYPLIYASLIMGVVGTVSRAGFLTLVLTLLLLAIFWLSNGRLKARRRIIIPVLTLAFAAVYLVPGIYWTIMENTIFTKDVNESGNFGNRSALIEAGTEVWRDYPVEGVGIGRFRAVSQFYLSSENYRVFRSVAHNLYVTLLAETGLVGFLLFMGWIAASMIQLYLTMIRRDPVYSPLATMWMIVFIIFLFKGYTASTMHYDKMLWMMGGISIAIYQGAQGRQAQVEEYPAAEALPGET